jgi:perosamine synthetase
MGPNVKAFEQAMADYLGVPHAVAVTNGTVALDLAFKVLGVGPGDEVIVPAMTYFATASMVSNQHAIPVFADIEPDSYNLSPSQVEAAIGPATKAIVFIDYGGNAADIEGLQAVADKYGIPLLQDAAQSLGGIYHGAPLGAQAPLSTMSFHMAKVMTTVEGGMVFTHDKAVAEEIRIRRNQGESGKYLHSHLGTNARMTDMTAAIGLAQFEKMEWLLSERRRVAERYNACFDSHPGIEVMRCTRPNSRHAYFFYPILMENRDGVVSRLDDAGIDTRIAYPMPVYEQELYASGRAQCRQKQCPVAERFTARVINLPIYPSLSDDRVDEIADNVAAAA